MGKNGLAVHHYVQYTRPGRAHLGREIQLLPNFSLEAPGLQKNVDSGETALDFDVHVSSVPAKRHPTSARIAIDHPSAVRGQASHPSVDKLS